MNLEHRKLATVQWKQLPFLEQMANIGSEVRRALNWKSKGNAEYCHKATNRILELLSLTLDNITISSHYKELARLKEAVVDHFYGENKFSSSDGFWRKYFDHFVYASKMNH
ncbi:MAG: hypothetical protein H8D54_00495 [Candidatus Omnitrophica bacterium]|nr:hypothetical protein [Candidatus Omnitrophota bacterium]